MFLGENRGKPLLMQYCFQVIMENSSVNNLITISLFFTLLKARHSESYKGTFLINHNLLLYDLT
jgi:hypothetical protein